MKLRFPMLAIAWSLAACAGTHPATAARPASSSLVELGHDLQVRDLGDGLWLHVSSMEMPGFGLVPSNGLVIFGPAGAVLVDTPWTPEQTGALVAWIEHEQGSHLVDVVVTHAHQDRTGGVAALPAGARIHALAATVELASGLGRPFSADALGGQESMLLGGERVETFFPGAGHTADNLVVWLPERRLLFGGCFVKAAAAKDLGNVADADVASWSAAVARVRERYPDAAVVVPGHGELGGTELLSHTGELVEAALR